MKPRISLITICVDDLEKSLRFYRDGLGFPGEGIVGSEFEYGAVAFFDLESNLKLALWPRKSLAKDSGLPLDVRPFNARWTSRRHVSVPRRAGWKTCNTAG